MYFLKMRKENNCNYFFFLSSSFKRIIDLRFQRIIYTRIKFETKANV